MAVLIAGGSCEQATTKARVLDLPLQRRRDKTAAVKLMRRLFKNTASRPMCWLLTSCVHMPQRTELRLAARHGQGLRRNDRAENRICRFVRRRERKMQRSNRPAQRNGCCPFMPQSRTRSTSNAISFSAMRSALSEVKRFRIGRRRLRPEQEPSPSTLDRPEPSSRDNPAKPAELPHRLRWSTAFITTRQPRSRGDGVVASKVRRAATYSDSHGDLRARRLRHEQCSSKP
jgi:hypothetical protein